MKKPKIFEIYCGVYGTNLLVLYEMPREKVRNYLEKKYKVKWEYGDEPLKGGACLDFPIWPYHVIWVAESHKDDKISKIAHEVFHHVLRLCKDKGIPTYPNIDNLVMDEAAAYLMEFYMREILKKLSK